VDPSQRILVPGDPDYVHPDSVPGQEIVGPIPEPTKEEEPPTELTGDEEKEEPEVVVSPSEDESIFDDAVEIEEDLDDANEDEINNRN